MPILAEERAVPSLAVEFRYEPGLSFEPFAGATLLGSWDAQGRPSPNEWSSQPMTPMTTPDGSPAFATTVHFDAAAAGTAFSWGVRVQRSDRSAAWGVFAEVPDENSRDQHLTFTLEPASATPQQEAYRLSWHRARGAHRSKGPGGGGPDGIGFRAWAPNARAVEVVFGGPTGYIADDGDGHDPVLAALPMVKNGDGVWACDQPGFDAFVGHRYMYRTTRDDGSTNWATDMFSRQQVGTGDFDPKGAHFDGTPEQLNGRPSCSVVADPSLVFPYPLPPATPGGAPPTPVTDAAFWADELNPAHPVPHQVEDLVIYELHVGALNPAVTSAGTFADALSFISYLVDLGVNAVELMPMFQFDGSLSWGYGSSHFLAIESSAGGRDALKQFVKTCHRHGIAILMDVVYNHYTSQAARAAWQYDSPAPSRNIHYWYQGSESQYHNPDGGYLDNVSSGWAPRYWDPHVRALFVSSAVLLADELHIDGLRVDQTASIHSYNSLHADGRQVGQANIFGRKFLRELCQTMKTIQPRQVLVAEDHSGWPVVTQPAESGGIGFDATWYVDFYHHLVGETGRGPEWAKLLWTAGQDPSGPLAMDYFAGALAASGNHKVVYESNHDEAGNDPGSARTILVAVNGAPLVGETRRYAEARCRFACGMSMLSAGTPMFLMGEEVGAQKAYTYDKFSEAKEDLEGLRRGTGAFLFRFYQDIIGLRLVTRAFRSSNIDVILTDNVARLLAFRRWDAGSEYLVVASLNNAAFDKPSYTLRHPALGSAGWRERFNSDSAAYGGDNVGNSGATLRANDGTLGVIVPANGFVVLERTV
jgi:1,4-alpha-glucan branching enzyme